MIERTQDNGEIVIDLRKLIIIYLRNWWKILLAGILMGLTLYIYTRVTLTPLYRATVTVYVNNAKSTQEVSSISTATLSASQQLVNTYINIIRSDRVLEKVLEELEPENLLPDREEPLTTDDLREMMTATQVESTEIFSINIRNEDPEVAAEIANVVARVSPDQIAAVVEGSSAQIIDYARTPEKPYNLNYGRRVLLGAAAGILSVMAFLTLRFLLDVRIKEEEDLTQLFKIPILGQIPSFTQTASRRSAYESGASRKAKPKTDSTRQEEQGEQKEAPVESEEVMASVGAEVMAGTAENSEDDFSDFLDFSEIRKGNMDLSEHADVDFSGHTDMDFGEHADTSFGEPLDTDPGAHADTPEMPDFLGVREYEDTKNRPEIPEAAQ